MNKNKSDLSRYAQKMLRDIIVDLDENGVAQGLGETIVAFDPVPSESNNWLKNPDKDEISGNFQDDKGRTHSFTIKKEKGEWVTVTNIVKDTEENSEVELNACPVCEEETMTEEEEELFEAPEPDTLSAMADELKALRAELNSYKAEKEAEKLGEMSSYAKSCYSENLINSTVLPQSSFEAILMTAYDYDKRGVAVYSEGTSQIGLVDTIKTLVKAIQPLPEVFSDKPVITDALTNSDELPTEVHADMPIEQKVEIYLETNKLDRSLTNLHRAYTYARYAA